MMSDPRSALFPPGTAQTSESFTPLNLVVPLVYDDTVILNVT